MAVPKNSNEAMAQRLLSDIPIKEIVGNRITPNKPTQGEPYNEKPYLVFYRLGGGGYSDLDGRGGLQGFQYRLEFHANTDAEAEALRAVVLDRLCGNRRKNLPVWRDLPNGVQGCFSVDDADADTLDDGSQIAGQTVTLWFCPQV